ncbi:MAG: ABC transporter permease [Deltaproteobacteria bacterium]|nr:ABC transporter permease [Deltaproteobacteria bacterium]
MSEESEQRVKQRIPYFGLTLVGFFLFIVAFGSWIAPHDPYEADLTKAILPPSWQEGGSSENLLGTDAMGRDIFSRLVFGARITLLLSLACISVYGCIGVIMGLISGYFGGKVDMVIMRLTDFWMSMPGIVMAILLVSVMGPGVKTIIIVVGILGWPGYARIVRGECLSLKERDFIRLAVVSGCSNLRIMFSHIFPNVINTLIILVTLDVGQIIVLTATLSFLGLGTQPPSADWGLMLFEGRQYFTYAWWLVTFPGIAILVAVLGFNVTGDWLREILDPKQKLR